MATKQYNVQTRTRTARPRSKRLRERGENSAMHNISTIPVSTGNTAGHSHDNKAILDAQSMDGDGYLYLMRKPDGAEDSVQEKVKAGHADNAMLWDNQKREDLIDQPVRTADSVTHQNITATRDFIVGNNFTSQDYTGSGIDDIGFGLIRDEDGNAILTADILNVRKSANFNEVVINQTTFELGSTVWSPGGCEITNVEVVEDVYRCYYDNKSANRDSGFCAGDQARCQIYDASNNNIIKYYWRVVKGVGANYVDLFISDDLDDKLVEGIGVPDVGDHIVVFGNRTDPGRQSAIVIDSRNGGSVEVYSGIDSFDLSEKNFIGLGVSPTTQRAYIYGYGDVFFGDRSLASQYMTFQKDAEGKMRLKINADVTFSDRSSGLSNLSEFQAVVIAANDALLSANEALVGVEGTHEVVETLTDDISTLNRRLDGVVENFFVEGTPTTTNYPVVDWDEKEKINHIGDTFTNINEYYNDDGSVKDANAGKSWRWCKCTDNQITDYVEVTDNEGKTLKLHWHLIADSDAVLALQQAAKAQSTADGKMQTFVTKPTPPYAEGDFWHSVDDRLKVCVRTRTNGSFDVADWRYADAINGLGENIVRQSGIPIVIPPNYKDGFDWSYYLPKERLVRQLEKGKTYTVTCQTSGEWTNRHDPLEEQSAVTLWITDGYSFSVIISDENTTNGTSFVWDRDAVPGHPQSLRFNSYGMPQTFWNLKIEEGDTATPWSLALEEQPVTYRNDKNNRPQSPKLGDLWIPGDTPHVTYTYTGTGAFYGWEISGDSTGTVINEGLITSGTIQLGDTSERAKAGITGGGTNDDSVRIWAGSGKSDMKDAPFRVLQDGTIYANKGIFGGLIQKKPTMLDIDNYLDYTTQVGDKFEIDLSKTGSFIQFGQWFSPGEQPINLYLPSIHPEPGPNVYIVTDAVSKERLRGLVDQTILLVNDYQEENGAPHLCICNNTGNGQCVLIPNGYAAYCTLKMLPYQPTEDSLPEEALLWNIKLVVVNWNLV